MGDHAGAKPLFVRAVSIFEKTNGAYHPDTASSLNNLALLLKGMGDYAGAKPLFVRALSISEKAKGPDHPETATNLNNLASLLQVTGDYAAAKPLLERALSISEKAEGPDHPSTGMRLNSLGSLLYAMGDHARAKPLFVRALSISERTAGPSHPSTGTRLNNLASLLNAMGDHAGAKALYERTLAVSEAVVRRAAVGLPRTGRLALVAVPRSRLDSFLDASPRFGSTGYAEVLRFKGLLGRLDALDHALARHADPALHDEVGALVALERRLSAMVNDVPPARDEAKSHAWRETYATLSAEREERTGSLAREFAPIREALDAKEAVPSEVQSRLKSGEVLVDVLRSGGRYLAWVVPAQGDVARLDLGKADEVEAAAGAFVEACARGEDPTAGQRLRDVVLAPLIGVMPASVHTLYLAPDAALAAVPFEALPGRDPAKALIDEVAVVRLSMAQDLVPGVASKPGTGALLLGGVDYETADVFEKGEVEAGLPTASSASLARLDRAASGGRFQHLPATSAEVAGLKERLGAASAVLSGSGATEGRLRRAATGKRVLHLATHGFVRDDLMRGLRRSEEDERRWMTGGTDRHLAVGHDPMRLSGLAMAGANLRDGADGDDGILSALEASYLDLEGCDLVVLSACETARGTAESGEGVLGLVHGFQLAGARNVVGSLWKVDDDATRLLMDRFYEGCLRTEKPLSPAAALREAALWLRDAKPGGRDYSAPRYWAAFVAYERR
jgi:CHAT domain-containing protein/Tfp pilus assembly protein PilF